MEWFQNPDTPERKKHWPRLVENHSAGISDLVPRVQRMYLDHLQNGWKDGNWFVKAEPENLPTAVCEEHAMMEILKKEAKIDCFFSMLGVEQETFHLDSVNDSGITLHVFAWSGKSICQTCKIHAGRKEEGRTGDAGELRIAYRVILSIYVG